MTERDMGIDNGKSHTTEDDTLGESIIIKKYANRRLYNMAKSQYVTLDDLAQMIRKGTDFVVYDAKSGDDITRSILTQIILDEEGKGNHLLPMSFLRDMIRFYGDNINHFVPDYWETSMQIFKNQRENIREGLENALGTAVFPLEQLRKVADNNRDIMQKTLEIFNPFQALKKDKMDGSIHVTLQREEYEALLAELELLRAKKS